MAGLLGRIRRLNRLGVQALAEPFAGGAGASLTLLYLDEMHKIYINDADPAIHDFWWCLVYRSKAFLKKLSETRVSMAEWRRQRDIYRNPGRASRIRRGFAAFYLNRCNHSGILLNGGPIGGIKQAGKWKLNARFNKFELRRRCEKVAEHRKRIVVSGEDGINFLDRIDADKTMLFLDPPYFNKGSTLYLDTFDEKKHRELSDCLHEMRDETWVLTYDDCPQVRAMYRGWASIRPFFLSYTANRRFRGREVLITPRWMQIPSMIRVGRGQRG